METTTRTRPAETTLIGGLQHLLARSELGEHVNAYTVSEMEELFTAGEQARLVAGELVWKTSRYGFTTRWVDMVAAARAAAA